MPDRAAPAAPAPTAPHPRPTRPDGLRGRRAAPEDPPVDRYADAVRARRAELRAARTDLTGNHRAELRAALVAVRLAAQAELADALAALAAQTHAHLRGCDRRGRAAFPPLLVGAATALREHAAGRRTAAVRVAARRVAARRGITLDAAWPPLAEIGARPLRLPDAEPGASPWTWISGGWRAALLPAASLPLVGLSVASPAAVVATAAVGTGAAVLVGGHQAASGERSRLQRWAEEVLRAVRADGDAALARALLRVEGAGAVLDGAVAARRAEVDAALAELAPAVPR